MRPHCMFGATCGGAMVPTDSHQRGALGLARLRYISAATNIKPTMSYFSNHLRRYRMATLLWWGVRGVRGSRCKRPDLITKQ